MGTPRSTVFARSLVFAGTAALAACSGGSSLSVPSSGQNSQSVTHSVESTSHQPSAPNPYPTTPGESYAYTYSLTLSNVPGTTHITTGSVTTTLGSGTFNGNQELEYSSVLNYTSPANNGTVGSTTTNEYDNFVGNFFYYYGHTQSGTETAGGSTSTSQNTQTYGSPFILDILPESNKNKAPEPGAYTLSASNSTTANGGQSSTESYSRNNDGSSTTTESITLGANTYPYSNTINSDFSASETNGIPGQPTSGGTTFSAPAGGNVTVTYTPTSGPVVTNTVPVWWGSTPLLSDNFKQIASAQGVPARCNSAYTGTPAVHLREILQYVDPVAGSTDSETIERYVISGTGVVCFANTRLVSYYANRTTGAALGTTSISVVQGLTSFSGGGGPPAKHDIVGFSVQGGSHETLLPLGLKIDRTQLGK